MAIDHEQIEIGAFTVAARVERIARAGREALQERDRDGE